MPEGNTTTYRRPSVSIGTMGLDGADYSYLTKKTAETIGFFITFNVPFKRDDIFRELLSDNGQLGSDGALAPWLPLRSPESDVRARGNTGHRARAHPGFRTETF